MDPFLIWPIFVQDSAVILSYVAQHEEEGRFLQVPSREIWPMGIPAAWAVVDKCVCVCVFITPRQKGVATDLMKGLWKAHTHRQLVNLTFECRPFVSPTPHFPLEQRCVCVSVPPTNRRLAPSILHSDTPQPSLSPLFSHLPSSCSDGTGWSLATLVCKLLC